MAAIIASLSAATGSASTRRFQTFVDGKIEHAESGGIGAAIGAGVGEGVGPGVGWGFGVGPGVSLGAAVGIGVCRTGPGVAAGSVAESCPEEATGRGVSELDAVGSPSAGIPVPAAATPDGAEAAGVGAAA